MCTGDLPIFDQTDQGIRLIEEERRRIARDLHDGPAQQLTNLSMRLDIIPRMMDQNPELAKRELSRINTHVIKAINDVRRLLFDLRPLAIDEVGLVDAVRELAAKYQRDYGLAVDVVTEDDITASLSPAKQVALYRLVQEIFNNIKKHAEATRLQVSFSRTAHDHIQIQVQDDGKGFDPDVIPQGHYGLIGMKERAQYLSGILDIQSEIGRGSQFTITVPAANTQQESPFKE